MKKFLLFPLVIASLVSPLVGEEVSKPIHEVAVQQKLIDEVMSDYHSGKYKGFLKRVDSDYKDANKKWEYNDALQERKRLSQMIHDYHSPKEDQYKKEVEAIVELQDQELIEVCLRHPNEKVSREVRDMVFFTPSQREQEALDYLDSLGKKFKGDGISPLENRLIRIDTEFWLKGLSLGIALSQNKIDKETYQRQAFVLEIEKLKQMEVACVEEGQDAKIQQNITLAARVLPKVQAAATTRKTLIALGEEKLSPKSETEKQLQAVMAKSLKKQEALVQKYFSSNSH